MKPKSIVRIVVDILMVFAIFFLMGYPFWGEELHEWAGTCLLMLFIGHHILNAHWHKSLFRRKFNSLRTLTLIVDVLVLALMATQMISGIMMSQYVFCFIDLDFDYDLAVQLHILCAYWGFVLLGIHLGLH